MSFTPSNSGASTPVTTATQQQQQQATTTAPKDNRPSLAGAKIKQRKGVAKAQAKFEPTVFRDELTSALSTVPSSTDYEGYLRILESLANELDLRKYESQLFELLIVGKLLAPGGAVLNDGAKESSFSVLGRDKEEQKEVVGVFGKLIRRYKYLQKPLETSSLPTLLQNANKLDAKPAASTGVSNLNVPTTAAEGGNTPGNQSGASTPLNGTGGSSVAVGPAAYPRPNLEKLATFVALAISSGLVNPVVLASIKRDHLVKDGTSLAFILVYLKTYLAAEGGNQPIEHLTSTLKKANCTDLLEFFPLQRRSIAELNKTLKAEKLDKVAEWYAKVAENIKKEEILVKLRDLTTEEGDDGEGRASNEEIIAYLESAQKSGVTPIVDTEYVSLIWSGMMSGLDLNTATGPQLNDYVLKYIRSVLPVFAKFSNGPRTEIALINSIQIYIYNHIQLLPLFPRIVQLLYNDDILSSQAIFYWNEKGAKPSGKQSFLKVMEPLVKAIKESEESDEEEDDE